MYNRAIFQVLEDSRVTSVVSLYNLRKLFSCGYIYMYIFSHFYFIFTFIELLGNLYSYWHLFHSQLRHQITNNQINNTITQILIIQQYQCNRMINYSGIKLTVKHYLYEIQNYICANNYTIQLPHSNDIKVTKNQLKAPTYYQKCFKSLCQKLLTARIHV